MKTGKRILAAGLAVAFVVSGLAGCGSKEKEHIELSLWSDERNMPLLEEGLEAFKELHKDEVEIEYTISMEREDTCKETVLADPEGAADIFTFADDQFDELYRGGALHAITIDTSDIIASVGGEDAGVGQVIRRDGDIYAYPETSGNGYFLFYNKAYFSEEDVQSLDNILKICRQNGKKFTYDYSSGWYLYSFFGGAGFTLECNEDGTQNICDWNGKAGKYAGTDVAEALLALANDSAFISLGDEGFLEAVSDGSVIAGVNGPWNAEKVAAVWGDDYGAAKLPTYTIAGDQVQMSSFEGYKLIGVNAYTKYPEWCMKLAEFLTSEDNQIKRFEQIGECPVNIKAAKNDKVKASPAIAALAAQAPYSRAQSVADPYWGASSKFGVTLAGGNRDGKDLQVLLDDMVKEATQVSTISE